MIQIRDYPLLVFMISAVILSLSAQVGLYLHKFVDQRILFYITRDGHQIEQISTSTVQLEADLWSIVRAFATGPPIPTINLLVSGMNDVLNAEAYAQAALLNRIPVAAWILMVAIAISSNFVVGYGARSAIIRPKFFILPLIVSISFFLIADLDSPRGGAIKVRPQNLMGLSLSMTQVKVTASE